MRFEVTLDEYVVGYANVNVPQFVDKAGVSEVTVLEKDDSEIEDAA